MTENVIEKLVDEWETDGDLVGPKSLGAPYMQCAVCGDKVRPDAPLVITSATNSHLGLARSAWTHLGKCTRKWKISQRPFRIRREYPSC